MLLIVLIGEYNFVGGPAYIMANRDEKCLVILLQFKASVFFKSTTQALLFQYFKALVSGEGS
jgi:hypothetical protein